MDSWAKAIWQDVGMSFSLDEISGDIPSPRNNSQLLNAT